MDKPQLEKLEDFLKSIGIHDTSTQEDDECEYATIYQGEIDPSNQYFDEFFGEYAEEEDEDDSLIKDEYELEIRRNLEAEYDDLQVLESYQELLKLSEADLATLGIKDFFINDGNQRSFEPDMKTLELVIDQANKNIDFCIKEIVKTTLFREESNVKISYLDVVKGEINTGLALELFNYLLSTARSNDFCVKPQWAIWGVNACIWDSLGKDNGSDYYNLFAKRYELDATILSLLTKAILADSVVLKRWRNAHKIALDTSVIIQVPSLYLKSEPDKIKNAVCEFNDFIGKQIYDCQNLTYYKKEYKALISDISFGTCGCGYVLGYKYEYYEKGSKKSFTFHEGKISQEKQESIVDFLRRVKNYLNKITTQ